MINAKEFAVNLIEKQLKKYLKFILTDSSKLYLGLFINDFLISPNITEKNTIIKIQFLESSIFQTLAYGISFIEQPSH